MERVSKISPFTPCDPSYPSNSYYSRFRTMLKFPTVHADSLDVDSTRVPVVEEKTVPRLGKPDLKSLITEQDIYKYLHKETGGDRLGSMFRKTHDGHFSDDLQFAIDGVTHIVTLTFFGAGVLGGMNARHEWRELNQATVFQTKFRALRSYHDAIFKASLKSGFQWGFKFGCFAGIFLLTSQSIAVYRNKTSPIEYCAGAALTGGLMKVNLGLKGFVAGSIIMGAFGLVSGLGAWGLLYYTGETQELRHYRQVEKELKRQRELQAIQDKAQGNLVSADEVPQVSAS